MWISQWLYISQYDCLTIVTSFVIIVILYLTIVIISHNLMLYPPLWLYISQYNLISYNMTISHNCNLIYHNCNFIVQFLKMIFHNVTSHNCRICIFLLRLRITIWHISPNMTLYNTIGHNCDFTSHNCNCISCSQYDFIYHNMAIVASIISHNYNFMLYIFRYVLCYISYLSFH